MASDRFFRALDILAGEAGEEMEKARQFEIAQNQRMEVLAEMNRQFEIQQKNLKLKTEEFEHEKGQDLIANTIAAAGRIAEEKTRIQDVYNKKLANVATAFKTVREGWQHGFEEEELQPAIDVLDKTLADLNLAPFDYGVSLPKVPEKSGVTIQIDPLTKNYLGTTGRKIAEQELKFGKIEPMLNVVEEMFLNLEPGEGVSGKFTQFLKSNLAFTGAFPEFKSYSDVISGMAVQTARMLGDVGNIAVAERVINEKMLPRDTDTKTEGLLKLEKFKRLVRAIEKGSWERVKNMLKKAGATANELKLIFFKTKKSTLGSMFSDTTQTQNFQEVFGDTTQTDTINQRQPLNKMDKFLIENNLK
jgi:regulator of RNase E activity RraB